VEVRTVASQFISHNSSDRDAEHLRKRLRAEGFTALFLLFAPDQGILAGRNWERELYPHLRKTDAVIFLTSTASVASRWCVVEVSLARSLGKPVFPLRLDGDAWLELLDDTQWVNLAEGERAYARLWEGLRRVGLDPADSFSWDPTRRPILVWSHLLRAHRGVLRLRPQDRATAGNFQICAPRRVLVRSRFIALGLDVSAKKSVVL
jgi:hypothetical protein